MEEQEDRIPDSVKTSVNELLFTSLPGKTTIDELEILACQIHDLIVDHWEQSKTTD